MANRKEVSQNVKSQDIDYFAKELTEGATM